ncbi:MAG: ribonuclease H-like domain-containing protein [Patescibacteria group bacterium]|nr:ribonuclease H-like domain-containing protein [Patescibacteria group bacterium]MDD4611356.1 ribonuclease H-like domain-containing protein [Patescibacteria group bacterium]
MSLIFDIETIGESFDDLDEATQNSLTRWIRREAGEDEGKFNANLKDLKEGLGFSPLTGEIVAIGVFDTIKNRGAVYFQSPNLLVDVPVAASHHRDPDSHVGNFTKDNFSFKVKSEKEMLEAFWEGAKKYKEFVSFNGRSFDAPFLMIRSAVHGIRPTINLMADRYLSKNFGIKHIDLLDQMIFYGAVRRRPNLHLFCRAFGIKSPKSSGITGDDVGRLFQEKEYKKIAEYNSWDLVATAELFKKWKKYISF